MENKLLDELVALLTLSNKLNRSVGQREYADDLFALSNIQMQAMIALRYYGTLNMSDLAEHILVSKPQLTKIVDALVERDLAVRRTVPENRRLVLIELSERGHNYLDKLILGEDSYLLTAFRGLSQEEIEKLKDAFKTICNTMLKLKLD